MSASGSPLTVGILAGEASGDLLGAGLMRALTQRAPGTRFIGVGGDSMLAAGLEPLFAMDELAVNGFREPIARLPSLLKLLLSMRDTMLAEQPAAFVGVDFNVFNLLLERSLKKRGITTVHYVSPSVYAWRRGRVRRIGRSADALLALYPFEATFYRGTDLEVHFVGHPMADEIDPQAGSVTGRQQARASLELPEDARVIALLPGSRGSELVNMLPSFLGAARRLDADQRSVFVVPCPRDALAARLDEAIARDGAGLDIRVVHENARRALTACDGALVKSGTATLEAMLLRRPMVVSYRLGALAARVARALIRSEFIALPNILASRTLVPELLQDEATEEALAQNLTDELYKAAHEPEYLQTFAELHSTLRQDANARAAEAVLATIAGATGRADTG